MWHWVKIQIVGDCGINKIPAMKLIQQILVMTSMATAPGQEAGNKMSGSEYLLVRRKGKEKIVQLYYNLKRRNNKKYIYLMIGVS